MNNSKTMIQLLPLLFVIFQCAQPPQTKEQRLDEYMNYCYENGLFNGVILVAENSNVIYNKAFGLANFESGDSLQTTSSFYLASVSKQFTAMAIMMLMEQNKLSYRDKLSDYFPDFPDFADQVTIEHLLTHTSGVSDRFLLDAIKPGLANQDVFKLLIKQDSLDFKPGEKFSYCNSGYMLLSLIIEKVSGLPFHEFMQWNIFVPLDMQHSFVYCKEKSGITNRAIGYNMYGDKDDYNLLTTGSGGIYSTVEDLFKWDQGLYTEKLVGTVTLQQAFTQYRLNDNSLSPYGFGWAIMEDRLGKAVAHDGGYVGFRSFIERGLNNRYTVIILSNKGSSQAVGIETAIRNILHNKPFQYPQNQSNK